MYKNDVTLNVSALGALPIVGSLFSHDPSFFRYVCSMHESIEFGTRCYFAQLS